MKHKEKISKTVAKHGPVCTESTSAPSEMSGAGKKQGSKTSPPDTCATSLHEPRCLRECQVSSLPPADSHTDGKFTEVPINMDVFKLEVYTD